MNRKVMCAALAASALMGAMTAARAEDSQMRVKLGDLNLATSGGAAAALDRIQSQADNFCEAASGREPLERTAVVGRCVSQMTRKSVAQLNAPLVTALLEGRSHDTRPAATLALAQR